MKSLKMKALAVAVFGLAGMGVMGSAFAACPDPAANSNQGYATPNGPWSGEFITSATIAAANTGLGPHGGSCHMLTNYNAGAQGNARVFVEFDDTSDEQRYRARFYVDLSTLNGNFNNSAQQTVIFSANSNQFPTGVSNSVVRVFLVGGATKVFRFLIADSGLLAGSGFKTVNFNAPTQAGVNRIEFDYNTATGSACTAANAHGSFCAWVTDGAAASGADNAPTVVTNNPYLLTGATYDPSGAAGWSGMDNAQLGLTSPSPQLLTSAAVSQVIGFDEFDSRRQTFIGQ